MSDTNNLYSLLGGKWMITDQFANSLIPYLLNILRKGKLPTIDHKKPKVIGFASASGSFEEEIEEDQKYVAVLSIKGPIVKYSQWWGPRGTKYMKLTMSKWEKDDSIVGVLLDIDSGGGEVSGTAEFAHFIHNYSKPVVSYTDGMICSAAFYIASGSREIVANKFSDCVGSIGTMIKYVDMDGAYKKLGAKIVEEYASKSTKKNNAFRLAKDGDLTALIKEELDPINEDFHRDVLAFRPQVKEENLNGQHISNMEKAKELGLIDVIGDKQAAIDRVFELAENNNNDKNESDMSAENQTFSVIAGILGQDEVKASTKKLSGKKGVFLSVEELNTIESKITGDKDTLADLQSNVDDGKTKIASLESDQTAISSAVDKALATAGLEAGATIEASIQLLGDKVKEYGSKPGTTATKIIATEDREPENNDTVVNANDGHNVIYNSI